MNPHNFFAELKRRNVYKVAVAYAVVAWLLIQAASILLPTFEAPAWVMKVFVAVVTAGFPIALIFSWIFELTSEGLKRTKDVPAQASMVRTTGRKLDFVIIGVLTLVVALLLCDRLLPRRASKRATREKSVAVLPFENRSEDKANAYFADGIQDEILTRLSKIADLKVISRTSTQHYKSAPENLREIARQLGVAHVVEGSVQKSGDAVRVNVQLIRAIDDSHLWADSFDRKITDMFAVESEVATTIAERLQAKLTGHEQQVLAAKPTDNPDAYDSYLRGLAFSARPSLSQDNSQSAQNYLREAVRLDPRFAIAWALLSREESLGYLTGNLPPTDALRDDARRAAETALSLQPNLGEGLVAQGYYNYGCVKDYDAAVRYFMQAREALPNNAEIVGALAFVSRRRGDWEKSENFFNEAEQIDPRNVRLLTQHALSYLFLHRFPQATRKCDQLLDIVPADAETLRLKAVIAQAEGDLARAASLLPTTLQSDAPTVARAQVYQAILERQTAPIIPQLKEMVIALETKKGDFGGQFFFCLAWAEELAGDHAGAQETWRKARSSFEPQLKEQPRNLTLMSFLALTYSALGEKSLATDLATRAMTENSMEADKLRAGHAMELAARVAAQTGEPARAIELLEKLLPLPYEDMFNLPLTPALLRLDPMFDTLRNDPRFQKLIEEKTP